MIETRGHGVVIDCVTKVYGESEHKAVDDVSLTIAPGEFMTFLGPSGSGKTTMLSMIAGFTTVTRGSICIDGEDVSRLKPHKRNLGVVFQHYALFPHLSVFRNVAYPLQQRGFSKPDIVTGVRKALRMVSLEDYEERVPSQLSGGQQQRVALARALVYEPRALLMDEPLGALDKRLRDQLQREIARMHQELGMTFIFVTHDQQEALSLSDRIAVFNEGKVEQVGTPRELYERPETLFVAQFLGESNCFDSDAPGVEKIVVRPENLALYAADGDVPAEFRRVRARITDVVYVGSHVQVGLELEDGSRGCTQRPVSEPLPGSPGEFVLAAWSTSKEARIGPTPSTDNVLSPRGSESPEAVGS